MAIVYSYIRFSSRKQKKGRSKDRQLEGKEWIVRNNHTEATQKLIDEARSGFHGDHVKKGFLGLFLNLIKEKKVPKGSILLVEHLDRLSRQGLDDAYELFKSILKAGVKIAVLKPEERIYSKADLNDFFALLIPLIYFHLAHAESKRKSDLAKDKWNTRREKRERFSTICPAWIDWKAEIGEFQPNEGAKAIKFIFERCAEGDGDKRILAGLQKSFQPIGRVSATGKSEWNLSYIAKVLRDEAVLGILQPREFVVKEIAGVNRRVRQPVGKPIHGYYPEVVEEDLWLDALGERAKRTKTKGPNQGFINIFRGLVFSAHDRCAMHMTRSHRGKDSPIQRRLVSYNHLRKMHGADSVSIDLKKFERLFLNYLSEVDSGDLLPKRDNNEKKIEAVNGVLSGVEYRIEELSHELDDVDGRPVSEIRDSIGRLNAKKSELLDELNALRGQSRTTPKDVVHVLDLFNQSDKAAKREVRLRLRLVLHDLIEKIWLKPEKHLGSVYTLVQIRFTNGAVRGLIFGKGIEGGSMSPTTISDFKIDLSKSKQCQKHVLKKIAHLVNETKPYIPAKSMPTIFSDATEEWVAKLRSELTKESVKTIPAQLRRLGEYLDRRGATDQNQISGDIKVLWSGWCKSLQSNVRHGNVKLNTARAAYRRCAQFLSWWGIDFEFPSAAKAIPNRQT